MIRLIELIARAAAGAEVPSPVALPAGVSLRRSRLVPLIGGMLSGMRSPAAAVTLGRMILVHPAARLTARLVRHELAHVAQWEREPVAFPLRYIAAHIRHGYADNPYEREARAAETGTEDERMT